MFTLACGCFTGQAGLTGHCCLSLILFIPIGQRAEPEWVCTQPVSQTRPVVAHMYTYVSASTHAYVAT